MLPILELPTIRHQVSRVSVELYHQLAEHNEDGRRTELIRGAVIEEMPRSPRHNLLVSRLYELARLAAPGGLYVRREEPMTLTDSEPEPDVAVVAGTMEDYGLAHPATALLVIEISVTTLELDREKASLYAEADVPEYWIVLAERGQIEAHTFPREGVYAQRRIYAPGETLASAALPALMVDLTGLFRV